MQQARACRRCCYQQKVESELASAISRRAAAEFTGCTHQPALPLGSLPGGFLSDTPEERLRLRGIATAGHLHETHSSGSGRADEGGRLHAHELRDEGCADKDSERLRDKCCESLTLHFPSGWKLYIARRSPRSHPSFGLAFGPIMCGAAAESGLRCGRESCCVHDFWCVRFVIVTVVAASIALAGCASDGTPASTGDSGSVGSFVRDLFRSNNEDQPPVPHNEVPQVASNEAPAGPSSPVERSTPKAKSGTSKPKYSAVPVTPAPKQQASAEPQSPRESATPPLLTGASPTVPRTGDNGSSD
jgi:hypothetical protein